jgi:hypothetical protein
MSARSYGAWLLGLCALVLMGMGLYFVAVRPPLLPEDVRGIGATPAALEAVAPGLTWWLRRVFWVLGGYLFTTGLLTLYVTMTALRARARGAPTVMAIAGMTSIGWMAAVNVMIDSDYKWLLLGAALLWTVGVALAGWDTRRTATGAPMRLEVLP